MREMYAVAQFGNWIPGDTVTDAVCGMYKLCAAVHGSLPTFHSITARYVFSTGS